MLGARVVRFCASEGSIEVVIKLLSRTCVATLFWMKELALSFWIASIKLSPPCCTLISSNFRVVPCILYFRNNIYTKNHIQTLSCSRPSFDLFVCLCRCLGDLEFFNRRLVNGSYSLDFAKLFRRHEPQLSSLLSENQAPTCVWASTCFVLFFRFVFLQSLIAHAFSFTSESSIIAITKKIVIIMFPVACACIVYQIFTTIVNESLHATVRY